MHEIFGYLPNKIRPVQTSLAEINSLFNAYHCCMLVPTYNNGGTLRTVIENLLPYTSNIIVVNDGSTDGTAQILESMPMVDVISHTPNQGKGVALRRGFDYARSKGYDYVITIDSDGQHYAEDIPKFIHQLIETPDAIIIGARNMDQASVPNKSSYGNKFSNFWYWVATGISLPDTQSGFRLYPLKPLAKIKFYTVKFEFEIEVIVRAAWRGVPVLKVPVQVYYPPSKERVTHFRPFRDFVRITLLNTVLVLLALFFYIPLRFLKGIQKKNFRQLITENITGGKDTNLQKALAISLGIFIGIAPLWGYQIISVIALAHLFRLNKVLAVLVSNISMPPMTPFIIYFSYRMGVVLMGSSSNQKYDQINWEFVKQNVLVYVVGSFALATLAAVCAGMVSLGLLTIFRKPKHLH